MLLVKCKIWLLVLSLFIVLKGLVMMNVLILWLVSEVGILGGGRICRLYLLGVRIFFLVLMIGVMLDLCKVYCRMMLCMEY